MLYALADLLPAIPEDFRYMLERDIRTFHARYGRKTESA